MKKHTDSKVRKRHLRIFEYKIHYQESSHLKKLVDKLWDRWTWDTGDGIEKQKIEMIEAELATRCGHDGRMCECWFSTGGNSQRKQRKRQRNEGKR